MRLYYLSDGQQFHLRLQEYQQPNWKYSADNTSKSIIATRTLSRKSQVISVIAWAILCAITVGLYSQAKSELKDRWKGKEIVQFQLSHPNNANIEELYQNLINDCHLIAKLNEKQIKKYLNSDKKEPFDQLYICMPNFGCSQWSLFQPKDIQRIDFAKLIPIAQKQNVEPKLLIYTIFGCSKFSDLPAENIAKLQQLSEANLRLLYPHFEKEHINALTEKQKEWL